MTGTVPPNSTIAFPKYASDTLGEGTRRLTPILFNHAVEFVRPPDLLFLTSIDQEYNMDK